MLNPPTLRRSARLAFVLAATILFGGVATRGQHRALLSTDLLRFEAKHSSARVNVIVDGSPDDLSRIAAAHHVTIVKWLEHGAVFSANSREITDLAGDTDLTHLAGDPIVHPGLAISNGAIAADQTRVGTSGLLGIGGIAAVTGQGIGVAVIDSGIAPHTALKNKIVANISFVTGDPSVTDAYGHGTHVAGIIAGQSTSVTNLYTSGIAPGVQLINVRVLGANGSGYTSDVINGIDWTIANRARYNIRIINLSLGHPVTESVAFDPLCQAVSRAVNAGIVVVVAAGNEGRAPNGARELGGITSPGDSPDALTVGAITTRGTVNRADDTTADYSSRGPTQYDFIVKPDLAAPGSSIVSLEAAGSYLPETYPLWVAGSGNNAYMRLSGTSMATPMVSGAAALLLQGSPNLSPAHVKIALQSGSTYMHDSGLTGAGAGEINVWSSRKVAANGLASLALNLVNTVIGALVVQPSGAFYWDNGSLSHHLYTDTGLRLLSALNLSAIWSSPVVTPGYLNLAGLLNPLQSLAPTPTMYGNGLVKASGDDGDEIIWGSTVYDSSSGQDVVWGSSDDGDEIIWGSSDDSTLTAQDPQ